MSERRDDLDSALRKETAKQWRGLSNLIAAHDHSPDALRLATRRRREDYAVFMRRVGEEAMTAEIDRLLRFENRVDALLERRSADGRQRPDRDV